MLYLGSKEGVKNGKHLTLFMYREEMLQKKEKRTHRYNEINGKTSQRKEG